MYQKKVEVNLKYVNFLLITEKNKFNLNIFRSFKTVLLEVE